MKAVDTNVLCRFFVVDGDDAEAARQRPLAVAAMSGNVFVSVTVVLEFVWVLQGFYEFSRSDILKSLRALAGIEHVTLEDRSAVLMAIDAYAAGLDFADALHLSCSGRCSALLTFDRRLAKRATALALQPKLELLA
jgi:predicted nucleic-acid-binding protein